MDAKKVGLYVLGGAIADGTYDFTLEEDGKKEVVPARFTFVLRRNKGVWQIATHHSSAQPE